MSPDQICAVVTTYRPGSRLSECIKAIASQVGGVVIVNDSGDAVVSASLAAAFGYLERVHLHHNESNLGIAASLNAGVSIAVEKGFEWLLTLDDDSVAMPDAVRHMLRARALLDPQIGIIGAGIRQVGGKPQNGGRGGNRMAIEKRVVITSGMLFSTALYHTLGPFRDEFFIDKVDTDYCLRARALGYRTVQLCATGFMHRLGMPTAKKLFGCSFTTYNYVPFRWYYQSRNLLVVLQERYKQDPAFCVAAILNQTKAIWLMLCFERDRRSKLRAIIAGTWHGLRSDLQFRWPN